MSSAQLPSLASIAGLSSGNDSTTAALNPPSTRAGGQDDGNLHKLPQILCGFHLILNSSHLILCGSHVISYDFHLILYDSHMIFYGFYLMLYSFYLAFI